MTRNLKTGLVLISLLLTASAQAGSATWSSNPATSNWNKASNWMPATVPNGPADTATFGVSSITNPSLSAPIEVAAIDFDPGASAFTISNEAGAKLTISGAGVTNNSGLLQSISNHQKKTTGSVGLYFTHAATAGDSVVYTNEAAIYGGLETAIIQFEDTATAGSAQFLNFAGPYSTAGGLIEFLGNSNAGSGTFRNSGTSDGQSFPHINFRDQASAGHAVFTTDAFSGGMFGFFDRATADYGTFTNDGPFSSLILNDKSSAGHATIINEGGTYYLGGAITYLVDDATAGDGVLIANGSLYVGVFGYGNVALFTRAKAAHGTFIANAGQIPGANGGVVYLYNSATADQASFTANGGVGGALGGRIIFYIDSAAKEATLVANGSDGNGEGEGGGIVFKDNSTGGTARVELHGNGFLDVQASLNLTIGSLEGDGVVTLGNTDLAVGSNNLSTSFSGIIQDGAGVTFSSLTKLGTGTLALSGANTYNGPTVIQGGRLVLNNPTGLATGNGPVTVEAGTLGGRGSIAGAVTVGTGSGAGSVLAPGRLGGKPGTLTIASGLTFHADATCLVGLNTKAPVVDEIVANGVTIDHAQFSLRDRGRRVLAPGTVLTVISNTAATPISGTFANLPNGSTFSAGSNSFYVTYSGGDGNDLTLTVVP